MSADVDALPRRALVVGCHGAFGTLLAARVAAAGMTVDGADRDEVARDDVPFARYEKVLLPALSPSFAALVRDADLVLFCVPEDALIPALDAVAALMRPDAVLMDIVSVKSSVAAVVERWPDPAPAYLSIHPMFGPAPDFAGRTIALVPLRPGKRADAMRTLVASWGVKTPVFDAHAHDRTTALVQVMPHAMLLALGHAVAGSGVAMDDVRAMATPIMKAMLSMLVRVAGGDRLTHWSLQTASPAADGARQALGVALGAVDSQVSDGSFEAFDAALAAVMTYLEPGVPDLRVIGDAIVADTRLNAQATG